MAWQVKQNQAGRFYCENHNRDVTETWDTREAAESWAADTNERAAREEAERKARAVARNAARAARQETIPTDVLTSRGDGWEGNGR